MRKASVANILPMLGILLATVMFTFSSIPVMEAFGDELTDSVSDLDRVSKAKTAGQLYFYNQAPLSASYAVHQSSYELAKGGGVTRDKIEWSYDGLRSSSLIQDSVGLTIGVNLGSKAHTMFREEYLKQPDVLGDCAINKQDFTLGLPGYTQSKQRLGIAGSVGSGGKLEVECENSETSVNYVSSQISTGFNSSDNRFYQLADDSTSFFIELGEEWSGNVNDEYTGSEVSCGSKDWESAEQDAVEEAENDIKNAFSQAKTGYPTYSGFSILEAKILDASEQFEHGTQTSIFTGTLETDSEDLGSCGCETCYNKFGQPYTCDCETEYRTEVTVKPQETQVKWALEDSKYRVPTKNGWKNLEFRIDSYIHSFQQD